jgi:predicted unusual protein kinase regulating ubiquinone biosynthesis (AarF/ABC1/UbiB family)
VADEIPKGRLARGFALVQLAAAELPSVAGRVLRGDDAAPMDLELARASAERAVKVLGDLRGLALKLGQTLSYVDGLLPPEATDVYQKTLSRLQSGAPTVTFADVRAEIERGLGAPLTERFVRFDETPIAAASIGQVHRASIRGDDGHEVEVAVKVQYPSIARALESDLKNLDVLRPFIAVMAPGADTDKGVDEVVEHLAAELDYTHEADNQDMFRALVETWEGVIIPRVYRSHTARNVITMDYVAGRSLREAGETFDQPTRDAIGRAVFRFSLGNALGRGVFNTDPHPGNYLACDDGRVAFLDFGSVKVMPPVLHARWRELSLLLLKGEIDAWRTESASLFGMEAMDPRARQHHQDFMLRTAAVVARDEEVTINRELLRDAVKGGVHTVKAIARDLGWAPSRSKTVKMPHDFVMAGRMQLGLFAVLAQLRPRANWNRILRQELGVP